MSQVYKLDYFTELVEIHFDNGGPWYYFAPTQQSENFCLDGGVTDTVDQPNKWFVQPFLSYISFEPAFPAARIPAAKLGQDSLEEAVEKGVPLSDYFPIDMTGLPPELMTPKHDQSGTGPFDTPNIWQMTGIPQPITQDKNKNPITDTSKLTRKLKKTVAKKFESVWNQTAKAYNARSHSVDGTTGEWHLPPPEWDFKCTGPGDPSDGIHRFAFTGALPAAWNLFGGRAQILTPAYAATIQVGQLDPKKWDTSVFPPVPK